MAMMKKMSMTILTMKICDTVLTLTNRVTKTKKSLFKPFCKEVKRTVIVFYKPNPFPDIQKVSNQEDQSEK